MASGRLRQRWLAACVAAGLLANLAGGFSFVVTAVFLVIYLTGVTLIGRDDEDAEVSDEPTADDDANPELDVDEDAEPYPDEPEVVEPEKVGAETVDAEHAPAE